MVRYSEELIEEIRNSNDIVEVISQYVILKRSLNFKSKYSYVNSERTDFGDINGNEEDGYPTFEKE